MAFERSDNDWRDLATTYLNTTARDEIRDQAKGDAELEIQLIRKALKEAYG